MHINDYFRPKYGTNLKKSLDKHEANSVYIIKPQSLDQLYSITAGIGGGERMKLTSQQECNEQHKTEITARNEIAWSQVRRISSFLFHVNSILDNKGSLEFSHFHICHFQIHCHLHMHNPLSTSLLNVPVRYNDALLLPSAKM